jgi:hypothetical protein
MATNPESSEGENNIAHMMKQLGLMEEDLDDMIFEEEPEQPVEATRWLAIARVCIEGEYSTFWFLKNMRTTWDLAHNVKTRTPEPNLHMFQFACLGGWERVIEGGPWSFRGNPVVIVPWDGFMKPSTIELFHIDIWIQIHDLPNAQIFSLQGG